MILFKNANLYTPKHAGVMDVLVDNGKVVKIGKNLEAVCETIDCFSQIICPMFVDGHEHLNLIKYYNPEDIIKSGVGTVVGVLAGERRREDVQFLLETAKAINRDFGIEVYCLSGSKNFIEKFDDFILNNKEVVGVKTALFQNQRPKPNLSFDKLKNDAITAYKAGLSTGKSMQVHIHLDHPFAKGEKVPSIEEINSGKLDNLDWIDKIVADCGVPYSLFKLTHSQKYYNRILEFAQKGSFIDYTASSESYDKRLDVLVDAIKNGIIDKTKISISSDLGIMNMERGLNTKESPISLLNTMKFLVLEKGLAFEDVLNMVTINALAPIQKKEDLIFEGADAKFLILDKSLNICEIIFNNKILKQNNLDKGDLTL